MTSRRHTSGFTLIEVLVVVIIVGIIMSTVVLSIGLIGEDDRLDREAQRFVSLIGVAQEEAVLQGRDFGLELMQGAYRFVEYDPLGNTWYEIGDDELFRLRELPQELEFDLYLEGKRVLLEPNPVQLEAPGEDEGPSSDADDYAPHILIFSSGDVTPFELAVRALRSDMAVVLQGNLLGTIEFVEDEV